MGLNCEKCHQPVLPDFAFCECCGWPTRAPGVSGAPARAAAAPTRAAPAGPRCVCGGLAFDSDGYCEACGRKPAPAEPCALQSIADIAASASHRGRQHPENQDAVGLLRLADDGVVMVVADGVSSACHSRQAAETAVQQALAAAAEGQAMAPGAWLEQALKRAHAAICQLPHDNPQLAEPQATVALALLRRNVVWYAWVGDSRVYLLDKEGSRLLSADDSWLNERLTEGVPYAAAAADLNSHCITQCLGMRDADPVIHVASALIPAAGWLLLCSDGLWNYLPDAVELWQRVHAAASSGTLAQACAELVAYANHAGGSDNITVAICRSLAAPAQDPPDSDLGA
jgi:serine/threonine protein phosphatase PrpC